MAAFRAIRNVRFDVATEEGHFAGLAVAGDPLVHAFDEAIEFLIRQAVLLKSVIVGMHRDRSQGDDDLVAKQNADVFALRRSFEQGRQICSSLGR